MGWSPVLSSSECRPEPQRCGSQEEKAGVSLRNRDRCSGWWQARRAPLPSNKVTVRPMGARCPGANAPGEQRAPPMDLGSPRTAQGPPSTQAAARWSDRSARPTGLRGGPWLRLNADTTAQLFPRRWGQASKQAASWSEHFTTHSTHTHTYTAMHSHTHTPTHTYTQSHTPTHTYTHTPTHTYIAMHTQSHTPLLTVIHSVTHTPTHI